MADFDYGNTRLRVMIARLLTRKELETMAECANVQGVIAALTHTAYRKPVEAALARVGGMDCIAETLRTDLVHTLGKVRAFYRQQAGKMAAIVFRSYEVQNLKAILRGLAKHVSPAEIERTVLPAGELPAGTLADLARTPDPRAAIDLLASVGLPFAQPLLRLRGEHPGTGISEMELALEKWYFQNSFQEVEQEVRNGGVLADALRLDVDLMNLLTVLRLAHAPGERKTMRQWVRTDDLTHLLVESGHIPLPLLAQAANQDTVNDAVQVLAETPYSAALVNSLSAYVDTALLSDMERQLKRYRLKQLSDLIIKDPLGIGVLIGYLALKNNEVRNVQWIAQGVNLQMKADSIKAELEFAK